MKTRLARDIMTKTVVTVNKNTVITECIDLMLRWHVSGLPVVDDDKRVLGILTEHDILNYAFSGGAADATAEEGMTKEVITFSPDTPMEEIVNTCASKRIRRAPIVEDGTLVGIVSRRDILREMQKIYNAY